MLQAQGPLTRIFRRYPRIRVFAVRFNDRRNIPPTASSEPTLGRQLTPRQRNMREPIIKATFLAAAIASMVAWIWLLGIGIRRLVVLL